MKKLLKTLLPLLFILPLIISGCRNDYSEPATIIIHEGSTTKIPDSGDICITGTVESNPLDPLDYITIMCLYKCYHESGMKYPPFIIADSVKLVASWDHREFKKINDHKYEFVVTEENLTMSAFSTNLFGIRVNARTRSGERSRLTWAMKPRYRI